MYKFRTSTCIIKNYRSHIHSEKKDKTKRHTGDHGLGSGRALSVGEFCTAPLFLVRISCQYIYILIN